MRFIGLAPTMAFKVPVTGKAPASSKPAAVARAVGAAGFVRARRPASA